MSFRFISWYVMSYTGIFNLYETKLYMICEFRLIPECSLLKPEIFSKKKIRLSLGIRAEISKEMLKLTNYI